jgi:hypothetical protein
MLPLGFREKQSGRPRHAWEAIGKGVYSLPDLSGSNSFALNHFL